jgi:hypothetical protein
MRGSRPSRTAALAIAALSPADVLTPRLYDAQVKSDGPLTVAPRSVT